MLSTLASGGTKVETARHLCGFRGTYSGAAAPARRSQQGARHRHDPRREPRGGGQRGPRHDLRSRRAPGQSGCSAARVRREERRRRRHLDIGRRRSGAALGGRPGRPARHPSPRSGSRRWLSVI
jgi:hypothetical protein